MLKKRRTSKKELNDVVDYWCSLERGSSYHVEGSIIEFLEIFTPKQIKGAMYIAKSKGRSNYFKYFCGIVHNWRKALENGDEPRYFDIDE